MEDRAKLIERLKGLIAENMVLKEYFRRIDEEQKLEKELNFKYGRELKIPKVFRMSTPEFLKITDTETGDSFVMESDDFYTFLATQKKDA